MSGKSKTYGGLPVSDDYLVRYGLQSDQEVYEAIAVILGVFAIIVAAAIVALFVLA